MQVKILPLSCLMAAPFFDDDLFDFNGADVSEAGSAESASLDDGPPAGAAEDGSAPGDDQGLARQSQGRRRKRGSRSGTSSSGRSHEKKWRSGAAPAPPQFDGDMERDPYCMRHYRRRLMRWVGITREFMPPNEQALRALKQLSGELEFEEIEDERFDHEDGISRLLKDLGFAFGEREIFKQGGVIRESMGRMQGESINAYIRCFRLLERKLADNKIPEYPEQAWAIASGWFKACGLMRSPCRGSFRQRAIGTT